MGIDLIIPSAEQIRDKLAELATERKKKLEEIRLIYKAETKRWNSLLKVAEQIQKECDEGVSIEVDPNADSLEIEGD